MSNSWIVSTNKFVNEPESIMRTGNVYQLANGYMGYRGTLDEFGPAELVGITLAGIFDSVGDAWREPVNAPNGGYTQVLLDDVPISALRTKIVKHRQQLHLRNAMFERETSFVSGGKTLTIRSKRFLSAANPHLGVIRFEFSCDKPAMAVVHTGIDFNIWDLNGPHLLKLTATRRNDSLLVSGFTNETRKGVAAAEAVDLNFGTESHLVRNKKSLRAIEVRLVPGTAYRFDKYFAVFTENDGVKSVATAAVNTVTNADAQGYDQCLADHDAEWSRKWDLCDVTIDGDAKAQAGLRYSIFQLLIAAPVNGSANSIPARALSGQVYKGAIFWDTEMFMFPFFLHTYPEKAVELLRYRIRTLTGARRKAQTEGPGYRGAFYAWESQDTGDDACTYFNVGDPITGRLLRTYFRDKQVHISGDVAIAMWEYFRVTGDDSLLLEGGAAVILECARFYHSYAYFKHDKHRYEILDVIGPDEYHERVNNNAFTSMVAKATFEIALAVAAHLRSHHPSELKALLRKIDITAEIKAFSEIASLLHVPQPDPKTGLIEQFDSYFKLRDISIEALKAQKAHPNEYLGGGQGLAVPTKIIKQADVVMMLNLFKDRFPFSVKKANWAYYQPRTEHGSSLSACAYAMLAADIGKLEWAYKFFLQTARIDLEAKYKVFVGTVFMGGSHPAANGGAWMTAIFGFAGLRTDGQHILLQPRLYRKWKSLEFKLQFHGAGFRIKITHRDVIVTADETNQQSQMFLVHGKKLNCAPGLTVAAQYRNAKSRN